MSSSFASQYSCPDSWIEWYITPDSGQSAVGGSQQFNIYRWAEDCFGSQRLCIVMASWTSSSTPVATVNSTGQATAQGWGVTSITGAFHVYQYDCLAGCPLVDFIDSRSAIFKVVRVTFQKSNGTALANPFRVGISATTLSGVPHDRKQRLRAVVEPSSEQPNVSIEVNSKLQISNASRSGGVITFDIVGISKSTSHGDAKITAKHSGNTVGTAALDVIVPNNISPAHDTVGVLVIANGAFDATTSPAVICLPPGQVQLATMYERFITVTVQDQFGGLIGDLYQGAEVSEVAPCDNLWHSINQPLTTASTYSDPVGVLLGDIQVPRGSSAANSWLTGPKTAWPNRCLTSRPMNPAVRVDGFDLNPSVANRTVRICGDGQSTTSPPVSITVSWP